MSEYPLTNCKFLEKRDVLQRFDEKWGEDSDYNTSNNQISQAPKMNPLLSRVRRITLFLGIASALQRVPGEASNDHPPSARRRGLVCSF
jgi:hypothetical protein